MNQWLWILLLILGLFIVVFIFKKVVQSVRTRRRKILDEFAHEIVGDFDVEGEKGQIKNIGLMGKREISAIVSASLPDTYKCPNCGGILTMRNGRFGKFIGCNQYPKCRYTRNIT
jgi:hypothetical protein